MKRLLRRKSTWVIGVAVVSLVVVACGGGGGDAPSASNPNQAAPSGGSAARTNVGAPPPATSLGLVETPVAGDLKVGARVGRLAPNFEFRKADGTVVSLADLRGTPVFINFWATWCGPCRFEMPEIQKMHDRLGGRLHVLALDLNESQGDVVSFFEELGLSFQAVIDKEEEIANEYRLLGLPSTFIVDADGVVQAVKFGPFVNEEDLNKSLEKVGL